MRGAPPAAAAETVGAQACGIAATGARPRTQCAVLRTAVPAGACAPLPILLCTSHSTGRTLTPHRSRAQARSLWHPSCCAPLAAQELHTHRAHLGPSSPQSPQDQGPLPCTTCTRAAAIQGRASPCPHTHACIAPHRTARALMLHCRGPLSPTVADVQSVVHARRKPPLALQAAAAVRGILVLGVQAQPGARKGAARGGARGPYAHTCLPSQALGLAARRRRCCGRPCDHTWSKHEPHVIHDAQRAPKDPHCTPNTGSGVHAGTWVLAFAGMPPAHGANVCTAFRAPPRTAGDATVCLHVPCTPTRPDHTAPRQGLRWLCMGTLKCLDGGGSGQWP